MSDATEKLREELQAARNTIAELQLRIELQKEGQQLASLLLDENRSALLFMLEDLEAGRKKIEQSHREWMTALDAVDDPMFLHDQQFRILRCNKAYQKLAGISFGEIIGRPYYEVFPKSGAPLPSCQRALDKAEEEEEEEEEEVTAGGAVYRSRAFVIRNEQDAYLHSVHILEDITEIRRAAAALHESEEIFRYFMEFSPIYIFFKDRNIRSIRLSRNFETMLGKPLEELLGKSMDELFPSDFARSMVEDDRKIMSEGRSLTVDETLDGKYYTTIKFPILIDGDPRYLAGYTIDITARKQAEASLEHANRALAALSAVNRTLVRASREDELLQSICSSIVEQRGYRMAWVGYRRHDEKKSIEVMAHAGHEQGYLDVMPFTWAESEHGMVPSGRAIRSGTTQLCHDIAADATYLAWRGAALERGYLSSIALPLSNSEVFGVLIVYAGEVNAFTPTEIGLLEEMAGDLAFGVRSLHTRLERNAALQQSQQHLAKLQDNLEDTVKAIATIVEMRDPYTAGHQARVADLAVAIAKQMELPDERAHGIHLAGIVHDLGKIRVPAEILSKPGKISDIERSLIEVHPQAGYDILKGIDFPWPVAQTVLQHHERIDGSGYPQGLKGEAILLEARIISVADAVEAISAHRPYRAGLGVDAALEEITKQRGILYEPQVVDACLTLFREQGYRFE